MPIESFMAEIDITVSSKGNFNIITLDHMKMNITFAGNTRHFCKEVDLAGSEGLEGMTVLNIKPQKTVSSATVGFKAHKNDVHLGAHDCADS